MSVLLFAIYLSDSVNQLRKRIHRVNEIMANQVFSVKLVLLYY
jgi:hypothetical protein